LGRGARGEEEKGSLLAGEIEQVEQRRLFEATGTHVLDDERAGRERSRKAWGLERARGQEPRSGALRPDRRQMALARALRADHRQHAVRPVRPALDERERCGVRRAGEKVLAGKAFLMGKSERELARSGRRHKTAQRSSLPGGGGGPV